MSFSPHTVKNSKNVDAMGESDDCYGIEYLRNCGKNYRYHYDDGDDTSYLRSTRYKNQNSPHENATVAEILIEREKTE